MSEITTAAEAESLVIRLREELERKSEELRAMKGRLPRGVVDLRRAIKANEDGLAYCRGELDKLNRKRTKNRGDCHGILQLERAICEREQRLKELRPQLAESLKPLETLEADVGSLRKELADAETRLGVLREEEADRARREQENRLRLEAAARQAELDRIQAERREKRRNKKREKKAARKAAKVEARKIEETPTTAPAVDENLEKIRLLANELGLDPDRMDPEDLEVLQALNAASA